MGLQGALLRILILISAHFCSVSVAQTKLCKTYGSGVIQTFYGNLFHLKTTCPITLNLFTLSGVNCDIIVQRGATGLMNRVQILVNKVTTVLQDGKVMVEGNGISLPFDHTYQLVYQYGIYIKLRSKVLPFSVTWRNHSEGVSSLWVQLDHELVDGMTGMCAVVNSLDTKAQLANVISDGKCVTEDFKSRSTEACQVLSFAADCGKRLNPFYELCARNMFSNINVYARCAFFEEVARQCGNQSRLWPIWREKTSCTPPSCPGDLKFYEQGSAFPPTCSDPQPPSEALTSTCLPPSGTVLNDRAQGYRCVSRKDCPCVYGGKTYAPGSERNSKCQSCVCVQGKWTCSDNFCPPTCNIEGQFVTTFDGKQYSVPGKCTYVAARGLNWKVAIRFSDTDASIAQMYLDVYQERYTFSLNSVQLGGQDIADLSQTDYTTVFWQSSMFVQVQTSFGIKIKVQVSPEIQMYLYLPPTEKTKGLCGTYNNNTEDDFTTSSGIVENAVQPFTQSWAAGDCNPAYPPTCINTDNGIFAEDKCSQLRNTSSVFARCFDYVPVSAFFDACVQRTCQCTTGLQNCLCVALSNYAKACASQGIKVGDWRAETACSVPCKGNLRFGYSMQACNHTCRSLANPDPTCKIVVDPVEGCGCQPGTHLNTPLECTPSALCSCHYLGGSTPPGPVTLDGRECMCENGQLACSPVCECPKGKVCVHCAQAPVSTGQKTCESLSKPISVDKNCTSGCYCPADMIEDHKGNCVTKENCTCEFSGSIYSTGQRVETNCKTCICRGGRWYCEGEPCPGVCEVYGNGQYNTFDSKWFRFDGNCQYTLVEDASGNGHGLFSVRVESVPCCDEALTCSRSISVDVQDKVTLTLRDMNVTQMLRTGWHLQAEPLYSVHTVGLNIIISVPDVGLTVIWDKHTRVKIILQAKWKGNVRGLCGNFDGKVINDFLTSSSSVVFNTLEFGNSWRTAVPPCSDVTQEVFPCERHSYCEAWAQRRCMILHNDPFTDCHLKVDPTPYYQACILESCSCEFEGRFLGFCTAVAAYADACTAQNVCINWRTPDLCPVYCDYYNEESKYGWHYEPCGQIKTCGKKHRFSGRLEGCYPRCPAERPYFDENTRKCSTLDNCTCYFNNTVVNPGDKVNTLSECCTCSGGQLICGDCPATTTYTPGIHSQPTPRTTTITTATKISSTPKEIEHTTTPEKIVTTTSTKIPSTPAEIGSTTTPETIVTTTRTEIPSTPEEIGSTTTPKTIVTTTSTEIPSTPEEIGSTTTPKTIVTTTSTEIPSTPEEIGSTTTPETIVTTISTEIPSTPEEIGSTTTPETIMTTVTTEIPSTPEEVGSTATPESMVTTTSTEIPSTPEEIGSTTTPESIVTTITTEIPSTPKEVGSTTTPETIMTTISTEIPSTPEEIGSTTTPETIVTTISTEIPNTPEEIVSTTTPESIVTTITTEIPSAPQEIGSTTTPESIVTTITTEIPSTPEEIGSTTTPETIVTTISTEIPSTPGEIGSTTTPESIVTTITTEIPSAPQEIGSTTTPESIVTTITTEIPSTPEEIVSTTTPETIVTTISTDNPSTPEEIGSTTTPESIVTTITTEIPSTPEEIGSTTTPESIVTTITTEIPSTPEEIVSTTTPESIVTTITTEIPSTPEEIVSTTTPETIMTTITTEIPSTPEEIVSTTTPESIVTTITTEIPSTPEEIVSTTTPESIVTTITTEIPNTPEEIGSTTTPEIIVTTTSTEIPSTPEEIVSTTTPESMVTTTSTELPSTPEETKSTTTPITASSFPPIITHQPPPVVTGSQVGCKDIQQNQSWPDGAQWEEDCFYKTCRNSTIEMRPVICPTLVPPVCREDLLRVVKDKQGCCEVYQCDCQCELYGDPHYVSFSGVKFDFLDNCTYTLVKEKVPHHNLSIAVDNYFSSPWLFGSSVKNVILKYRDDTVTLMLNEDNYTVEAALNQMLVQPPYEENGIRFEGTNFKTFVYMDGIRSHISFDPDNTLQITLAMEHFRGNTLGQCGVCGGPSCVRRNGLAESDDCCDKTSYDWIEGDPLKPYCGDAPRNVPCVAVNPTPPPPEPPCPAPLCELLEHEVFRECSQSIDVETLVKNCRFDYCVAKSNVSICSSLQHLSEQCKRTGICVYWRNLTEGVCDVTCPEEMIFDECRSTPDDVCQGGMRIPGKFSTDIMRSGCFCPDGKALAEEHKTFCVSECTKCKGPLGEPKLAGAIWESNCHICTCNSQTLTEECSPIPPTPSPICSSNSTLVSGCCNNQICVEKTCEYNGKKYKVGDTWKDQSDPCVTFSCTSAGTKVERSVCPAQSCSEEFRVWDENHCCYSCNLTCAVRMSKMTIKVEGCTQEVQLPSCEGYCPSNSMVVRSGAVLQLGQEHHCCRENSYEIRKLSLTCSGSSTTHYTYNHITGCECQPDA